MISRETTQADAAEYYATLDHLNMSALWRAPEQPVEPNPPEHAHVWHWQDVHPALMAASNVMGISSDAQRRVVTLQNAGIKLGTTQTMTAALQLVLPGEVAPAHRHAASALRFVINAESGYTVTQGEKIPMHNGDLILTPGWTWHDHANESDTSPMIWMDLLDVPYVVGLRAGFREDYPGYVAQPQTEGVEASLRFGGSLLPTSGRPQTLYSPLNVYPWQKAYDALKRMQVTGQGRDPVDGAILEYVNPVTGGHVLPTIACFLQVLARGERTKARQQTTSKIYYVARGHGYSVINGLRVDWEEHDIFCVPSWAIHEHAAESEEAVLFSSTDLPIFQAMGLYRERAYKENGGHQVIAAYLDKQGKPAY